MKDETKPSAFILRNSSLAPVRPVNVDIELSNYRTAGGASGLRIQVECDVSTVRCSGWLVHSAIAGCRFVMLRMISELSSRVTPPGTDSVMIGPSSERLHQLLELAVH